MSLFNIIDGIIRGRSDAKNLYSVTCVSEDEDYQDNAPGLYLADDEDDLYKEVRNNVLGDFDELSEDEIKSMLWCALEVEFEYYWFSSMKFTLIGTKA